MGNCSGHWNKDDMGKFERRDHKSKFDKGCFDDHKHDHKCDCDSCCGQPKHKNDGVLVDKVICSKEVQKVVETDLTPFLFDTEIGPGGVLSRQVGLTVNSIAQNVVVLRDKVVNIGFINVTFTVDGTPVDDPFLTGVNLPFQEETECPGACPEDTVLETPLQVEAIIIQPIPRFLAGMGGNVSLGDSIRFKVILRTTLTVVRPVIKSKDGCFSDVNQNRCETPTPLNITLPVPPTNGG